MSNVITSDRIKKGYKYIWCKWAEDSRPGDYAEWFVEQ